MLIVSMPLLVFGRYCFVITALCIYNRIFALIFVHCLVTIKVPGNKAGEDSLAKIGHHLAVLDLETVRDGLAVMGHFVVGILHGPDNHYTDGFLD